jgi:dUTP pyrophosphatase
MGYHANALREIIMSYKQTSIVIRLLNKTNNPLTDEPYVLQHKTHQSAGFDIVANENEILAPGEVKAISTGLFIDPDFTYTAINLGQLPTVSLHPELQIRSRSGLVFKHTVFVMNAPGTIDSDYRDEIKILLANFGKKDFIIEHGERIAQGVFTYFTRSNIDVKNMSRSGGFGHTG